MGIMKPWVKAMLEKTLGYELPDSLAPHNSKDSWYLMKYRNGEITYEELIRICPIKKKAEV